MILFLKLRQVNIIKNSMPDIRVIHLLPSLSRFGGTPRKVFEIARSSSVEHFIFCYDHWEGAEQFEANREIAIGRGLVVFDISRGPIFFKTLMLLRLLSIHDITHIHSYFDKGRILAFVASKIRNVRTVTSFVGRVNRSRLRLIKFILGSHDCLTTISQYLRSDIEKHFGRAIADKTVVIPNGADASRGTRGINKKNLLSVTGLNNFKNIFLMPKIMEILKETDPDIKLTLVGDGPLMVDFREQLAARNVLNQFELKGYLDDLSSVYLQSDIFIHTADQEGFGISVAEAMHAGFPILVSDRGGAKELVQDEKNGFILPYDNPHLWAKKILELYRHESLLESLGKKSSDLASIKYSLTAFIRRHDMLYHSVMKRN